MATSSPGPPRASPSRGRTRSRSMRSALSFRPGHARRESAVSSLGEALDITRHLSIFPATDDAHQEMSPPPHPNTEKIAHAEKVESIDKQIAVFHEFVLPDTRTPTNHQDDSRNAWRRLRRALSKDNFSGLIKFARFLGPGMMVSATCIDSGSFSTDIVAGVTHGYKMLCLVLLANIFGMFMQSLSARLGSVTGLNLAQMIKLHTPTWLSYALWVVAELSIILTDAVEVMGIAIALNLLFKLPLIAGCLLSLVEAVIVLAFWGPKKSLRALRFLEWFMVGIIIAIVVCLCIQLSVMLPVSGVEVLRGYLPSSTLIDVKVLIQLCGIIGTSVTPEGIYFTSGTVQPRLLQYDQRYQLVAKVTTLDHTTAFMEKPPATPRPKRPRAAPASTHFEPSPGPTGTARSDISLTPIINNREPVNRGQVHYAPSITALRHCLRMSIVELLISIFVVSVFINSALLILAATCTSNLGPAQPHPRLSLFDMYDLLHQQISPSAATIFAVSLLLCSAAAGIVATIAGQIISEAQLPIRITPWVRRILTRGLGVIPAVAIAASLGKEGLNYALLASQILQCFCLPFVVAPLLWFTACSRYCGVQVAPNGERLVERPTTGSPDGTAPLPRPSTTVAAGAAAATATMITSTITLPLTTAINELDPPRCATASVATVTTVHGTEEVNIAPWQDDERSGVRTVQFRNHWAVTAFGCIVLAFIVLITLATLALLIKGVWRVSDEMSKHQPH